MAEMTKILIIGGTGYIGKFIVKASAKAGHPTFVLVRESTLTDPSKSSLVDSFKKSGVTFISGDLYDHETLVKAIKQVDVVISTVGQAQLADQVKIVATIKEAGNIKKFYPSEFGNDADRANAVEPAKTAFATKAQVRRAIEAESIPYTYITSNCFAGYFLPTLAQPGVTAPPRDKVVSLGDGNAKVVFNDEHDIATYTIKTVDDLRTVNKSVYIKPPGNIYSFNELVSLWEKKTGKTLVKIYLSEEQVLKNIEESPFPVNLIVSLSHAIFVKGDQTNFEIEPSFGVEASELYPDVKFTTVDEYLSRFLLSSSVLYNLRSPQNHRSRHKMAEKSKILIIGGTGYMGKFIVEASANAGHPTFVLVRESTLSDPSKSSLIESFNNSGVTFITVSDLYDHESLVNAIKQVDVVISAVGPTQLADQVKIVTAIKGAGNIKKFYPSEFAYEDRSNAVEPAKAFFTAKAQVRRAVEAENIPYTSIHSNCFAGYFLPTLAQPGATAPPRDKVVSLGDGNAKGKHNFSFSS
ncbi:hypothetical protein L1987_55368 [Smallanthus sonchifolius]|uniref:Uncharacterized protein n=1 Tax=Smallanthus sonchifolius TaxID=185202 RepID=A0ACB9E9P0_9ASTR|nr:hypothetical protein L1987_55368 [Smallanthus sonchifolius]